MAIIEANGVSFHVQRLGEGPPVVMIHGLLFGNLASWYFTAAPALAETHEVFLYDLRGHGRSERVPTGYDLATQASDLNALTAEYRATPMTIVGTCYGALVALRFALDFPERVARLALVEIPLPLAPPAEEILVLFQGDAEGNNSIIAELAREYLGWTNRKIKRFWQTSRFLLLESSLRPDLEAENDILDADLASLQYPVMCLYGERSPCRHTGDRLVRVMPNAQRILLPGGHFLSLECKAELTEALVEFAHG